MAFLTTEGRAHVQAAYDLLKNSYVTEQATIPEDVAKHLAKASMAIPEGTGEMEVLRQLRDRPIKTLLYAVLYADAL